VLVGKVEGFNWLMAAMSAIQQPTQAQAFHTAQGRFLATIDAVERALPAAKADLDRVVRPNNLALEDMIEAGIRTHVVDLVELLRPLRRLRAGAAELAEQDLPNEVERIMLGAQLEDIAVKPVPVHTGEEIGEIARTVDGLHAQALKLAVQQQLLSDQVNNMFET